MICNFSEACNNCDALPLHDLRLERLMEIEARAERIGALVAEGAVICEKGPRRFVREGHDVNACRVNPRMPVVSEVELAEEIAAIWPNAPLQPVAE